MTNIYAYIDCPKCKSDETEMVKGYCLNLSDGNKTDTVRCYCKECGCEFESFFVIIKTIIEEEEE